jgi:hypothetical protein
LDKQKTKRAKQIRKGPMKNNDSSKLNKMIDDWNKYLNKLKQEEEHSLNILYDYDIEPLPNDLVDMINEKNKREK